MPETEAELPMPAIARSVPASSSSRPTWIASARGRLFLDRRGRRRWCDTAVCGNREKARRHAARARGG